MNPLLKHPVLQYMPYKLLKNPNLNEIRLFLEKRRKEMNLVRNISLSIGISIGILFSLSGSSIGNWIMVGFIIAFGIYFHKIALKTKMSDQEINENIQTWRGSQMDE